jgi:hypothetical protein
MQNDYRNEIAQARACVILIGATDILLSGQSDIERAQILREARRVGIETLRTLVTQYPPEVTADIMEEWRNLKGSTAR